MDPTSHSQKEKLHFGITHGNDRNFTSSANQLTINYNGPTLHAFIILIN